MSPPDHLHACPECYENKPCNMACSVDEDEPGGRLFGSHAVCDECKARRRKLVPCAAARRVFESQVERLVGHVLVYAESMELGDPADEAARQCRASLRALCGGVDPVRPLGPGNPAMAHAVEVVMGMRAPAPTDGA